MGFRFGSKQKKKKSMFSGKALKSKARGLVIQGIGVDEPLLKPKKIK